MRNLLLWLGMAGALAAQGLPEIRLKAGGSWFLDEVMPAHATIGGSVRLPLAGRLGIEPEFLYLRRAPETSFVVLPSLTWDVARGGRVVPYLMGGLGLFHSRTELFPGRRFTANDLTFLGGGGMKLFLNDRVFFYPEFRMGVEPNVYWTLTAGVGFVLSR